MRYQRRIQLTTFLFGALTILMGCGPPAATSTASSPAPAVSQPRAIVIDTDMAADDWMAILYLLHRPDVTVKAITVSGTGETHCAPGIRHVFGLEALSGNGKIPVACGRETPLQGSHAFPESWRAGVDQLLGLTLPASQEPAANQTAVDLLASVIQSSPVKVTVLTLGPLTNLAEALQKYPALVDHIDRIYIMGGAVNLPGNVGASGVGIDNHTAEWNIYVDPHAANVVLQSHASIALVALDATNQVPLNSQFYDRLKSNHPTATATFVFDVLTKKKDFIDSGGYFFWDPLAAVILTDGSLATFQTKNLCVVEQEGPDSGQTKSGNDCPALQVAVSAEGKRFEQIFLDTLNTPKP